MFNNLRSVILIGFGVAVATAAVIDLTRIVYRKVTAEKS